MWTETRRSRVSEDTIVNLPAMALGSRTEFSRIIPPHYQLSPTSFVFQIDPSDDRAFESAAIEHILSKKSEE
jgi:hypothetical protein